MNKPVITLSVAALVTVSFAAYQWQELRTARELIAALQTRMNETQPPATLGHAMPELATPMTDATHVSTLKEARQVGSAPNARPNERAQSMAEGIRQLLSSPEGRNIARSTARMMLTQRYPDLGKELNLSPAEEGKLLDLISRQQVDMAGDSIGLLDQSQDPAARQQIQRQLQDRQKANEAEIVAALGSKYSRFQRYQENLAARQQVAKLKSLLGTGNNALTDAQSRSLVTLFAAEQKRIMEQSRGSAMSGAGSEPQGFIAEQLRQREEANRRLVEVATTQLNPLQLDNYRKMLEQETSMSRGFMNAQGLRLSGTDEPTIP